MTFSFQTTSDAGCIKIYAEGAYFRGGNFLLLPAASQRAAVGLRTKGGSKRVPLYARHGLRQIEYRRWCDRIALGMKLCEGWG